MALSFGKKFYFIDRRNFHFEKICFWKYKILFEY